MLLLGMTEEERSAKFTEIIERARLRKLNPTPQDIEDQELKKRIREILEKRHSKPKLTNKEWYTGLSE